MTLRRPALADAGLVLLALATVAACLYVLGRDPAPVAADRVVPPSLAAPSPAGSAAADVEALLLGGDLVAGASGTALGEVLADALGWSVAVDGVAGSGFVAGAPGATLPERLPAVLAQDGEPDVVVVAAATRPADVDQPPLYAANVAHVVDQVREALPAATVVLLAPVSADPAAFAVQRSVLTDVAARFGAYYVDATGRGYLAGPGLVAPDGTPTEEGVRTVGRRLAAELRTVLPPSLLEDADVNGG